MDYLNITRVRSSHLFFKIGVLRGKFRSIQRKSLVLESLSNKVAGLRNCEIFKNSLFHKTSLVAASQEFINFTPKFKGTLMHIKKFCNKFVFI